MHNYIDLSSITFDFGGIVLRISSQSNQTHILMLIKFLNIYLAHWFPMINTSMNQNCITYIKIISLHLYRLWHITPCPNPRFTHSWHKNKYIIKLQEMKVKKQDKMRWMRGPKIHDKHELHRYFALNPQPLEYGLQYSWIRDALVNMWRKSSEKSKKLGWNDDGWKWK